MVAATKSNIKTVRDPLNIIRVSLKYDSYFFEWHMLS